MKANEILENETSNQATRRPAALNRAKQLLAASVLAAVAFAATGNAHALPIKNGGFETGDVTGWSTSPVFGGVTSDEAYSGNYSLEIGFADIVYQNLPTLKRFGSLRFKAKAADSLVRDAYARVDYADGSSSEIGFDGLLSSDDWTDIELALNSTKDPIRVTFSLGGSPPIYIDNVALLD